MALWPFRRRSGRKRTRSGAALSDAEGPPTRSYTEGALTRVASKKKQRTDPAKLSRRARTHSYSPGRNDSIHADVDRSRRIRATRGEPADYDAGVGAGTWERTPTLNHGVPRHHPTRRKTSRRKREDREREREIKAMSNFMPVRPATDMATAGRPMKKETKRVQTMPLGHWDNPASDVSLPLQESIHSSLSSDSEFGSFRVSALDALAPRPTLRYTASTRWTTSRLSAPERSGSQKRTAAERPPISKDTVHAHKRIDELADDLDAGDLRELMERDNRRRERKRKTDQEKMGDRLARRAEKQKAQVNEAGASGATLPENYERGVLGRELVGLGIDPPSAVRTSARKRDSDRSEPMPDAEEDSSKKPLDTFHRTETMPADEPEREPEREPEPVQVPTPLPEPDEADPPSRFAGLLRSKKSRSKSTLGSDKEKPASPPVVRIEEEGLSHKDSQNSNNKPNRFSFTSFLRRSGRIRRDSAGPSSFSNTSREEMHSGTVLPQPQAQAQDQTSRAQAQAPVQDPAEAQILAQAQALAKLQGEEPPTSTEGFTGNYVMRKPSSAAPKRTRSRFREDLPDFPISPPDSRVQSPEAGALPAVTEHGHDGMASPPVNRRDTFGAVSLEGTADAPSPGPHQSISLASIDSEGSWLSGRATQMASAVRDSLTRSSRQDDVASNSPSNSTQEDLAIADDEYMSRLAPERNSALIALGRKSGEAVPSSDEESFLDEADVKWGAVGARPHVVHVHRHNRDTFQSREGLLNLASGDEDSESSPISPTSANSDKPAVQRATSVHVGGGHGRNFSAGSAKLLDLTPRTSVDHKPRNGERRASEPFV